MASATSALSVCCSLSCAKSSKPIMYSMTSSSHSCLKPQKSLNFDLSSRFSQMGMCQFTPWNGLKHVGISILAKPRKLGSRKKRKEMVVYASLFGVGAPELLVIGAVALMVFGPKGLAEVARSLGKTLREFQPAIKELQDVSREFKSTLEREIGLDDDPSAVRKTNGSNRSDLPLSQSVSNLDDQIASVAETNGAPLNNAYSSEQNSSFTEEQTNAATQQHTKSSQPENRTEFEGQPQEGFLHDNANSSEDQLKITEEQPRVPVATQQDATSSPQDGQTEIKSQPQGAIQETATAAPAVHQMPESET
uniref:Twin-arginine translocation protein TatB n=1 Tax=Opuntia streptacantha TaxID=393608 RepID=A0A7C8ZRB8_OPUST